MVETTVFQRINYIKYELDIITKTLIILIEYIFFIMAMKSFELI